MRQSLALSRNLANNDAPLTMPDQRSASRINLRLLLEILQGCSGITYEVVPCNEVLHRFELFRRRLLGVFGEEQFRACTDCPLIIAQPGDALLGTLVSDFPEHVGCESPRLIAIAVSRSASRDDYHS